MEFLDDSALMSVHPTGNAVVGKERSSLSHSYELEWCITGRGSLGHVGFVFGEFSTSCSRS